jgi:FO synthase
MSPREMESLIRAMGRVPRQRTTLYADVDEKRYIASLDPPDLIPMVTGLESRRPRGEGVERRFPESVATFQR